VSTTIAAEAARRAATELALTAGGTVAQAVLGGAYAASMYRQWVEENRPTRTSNANRRPFFDAEIIGDWLAQAALLEVGPGAYLAAAQWVLAAIGPIGDAAEDIYAAELIGSAQPYIGAMK
jgi:hypothetical protein